jgi:hypothetical protein
VKIIACLERRLVARDQLGAVSVAVQWARIAELIHGHDLNHLIRTRLAPNRSAVGLRLLARNLAIRLQIHDGAARPAVIRELRLRQHVHTGVRPPDGAHRRRAPADA